MCVCVCVCERERVCVCEVIDTRGERDWKRNHTHVLLLWHFVSKPFLSQPKPAPLIKILHICRTKRGLSDTHFVNISEPTV